MTKPIKHHKQERVKRSALSQQVTTRQQWTDAKSYYQSHSRVLNFLRCYHRLLLSAYDLYKQFGDQDGHSVLIWIQTVWHCDGTYWNNFSKMLILKNISRGQQKHEKWPSMQSMQPGTIFFLYLFWFFFLFDSLRPSQQFFSYVGTGLPGLNQY